ncbi:MAG TPA: PKD domain-containing protein [Solirubrobacteraceae bacterium]|nr:PKD domain-containing protein [Solirubrobacteraceae bacterium]
MRRRIWGIVACGLALAGVLSSSAQARALGGLIPDQGAHRARVGHIVLARDAGLPYGGGPVLHRNRTHVIFWAPSGSGLSFDPGYESLIETFLANVAAASRSPGSVYGLSGQYRDAQGPAAYASTYGGAVTVTDPLPSSGCTEPPATGPGWRYCLTDHQLQREIERAVRADRLPTGPTDVYFLVTPNGLGDCSDSASTSCALGGDANGYCAYHSQSDDGLVLYAVIPYNAVPGHCQSDNPRPNGSTADPALSTISHEQSEMITDPAGNAWIDPRTGNEDGDLCLTSFGPTLGGSGAAAWNEEINGGHYYLQEEWSNADGGCEARAKPDSVSFGSAPATGAAGTLAFTAHTRAPHGKIAAFQWFFGDHHTGRGHRVTHRFAGVGTYRVILRTTDSWGNWGFYARTVVVSAASDTGTRGLTKSG